MSEHSATRLSVNLNAIAMLRNRRDLPWPSVTGMGAQALAAGAHGLTVHPRPDQRHIRFSDVPALRALLDDDFPSAEFNIEGYPTEAFLELVEANQPDQATLVPDDPAQATSDHGWNLRREGSRLKPIIARLKKQGIRVSLFVDGDGDASAMDLAAETGADRVELYTGPYGAFYEDPAGAAAEIERLGTTADAALAHGIGLNAGHDLTVANLPPLLARIPSVLEVSIGHGLTADALQYGMKEAVRRFLAACGTAG